MSRVRKALDKNTVNRKNGLLFGICNVRILFKSGAAQTFLRKYRSTH